MGSAWPREGCVGTAQGSQWQNAYGGLPVRSKPCPGTGSAGLRGAEWEQCRDHTTRNDKYEKYYKYKRCLATAMCVHEMHQSVIMK